MDKPNFAVYYAPDGAMANILPNTLDDKSRTVDVVWYGGATVPRMDPETGDQYMLRLNMDGCRMERLNAGAPVFDGHQSGSGLAALITKKTGTKAQVGAVQKAWTDGQRGLATLQFRDEGDDEDTDQLFNGIKSGIIRNLSFGTWIYKQEAVTDADGNGMTARHPSGDQAPIFAATDWEPFEVSAVPVPADFSTCFLSVHDSGGKIQLFGASGPISFDESNREISGIAVLAARAFADELKAGVPGLVAAISRAISPKGAPVMEPTTQDAGALAREQQQLLAAASAEATRTERDRVSKITAIGTANNCAKLAASLIENGTSLADAQKRLGEALEIRRIGTQQLKHGITQQFVDSLIDSGESLDSARGKILDELSLRGDMDRNGGNAGITSEGARVTRDGRDSTFSGMQSALLLRFDPQFGMGRRTDAKGNSTSELLPGRGTEYQRKLEDEARSWRGFSLMEMARKSLELSSVSTNGWNRDMIAEKALSPQNGAIRPMYFEGAGESTSDFPNILANVAYKTLRQAYEAFPQTFKAFSRMVTASDFKPINRVQLSDATALSPINERGEFAMSALQDTNQKYSLATFGNIVSISRKAIINDDLNAFTRVPAVMGVSAARMESDTVWAVITGNQVMGEDNVALFASGHSNNLTGAGSALALAGLSSARSKMRLQTGQKGTPLNLTPRYALVPTVLETTLLQLISPLQLAASAVTGVVPSWIMDLVPVVEPRLDAAGNGATTWYLVSDNAVIDTIEYCYLEGQGGVYLENRQGFEVDGIQMKAREDFAAAAIDYRGLQRNVGV